MASMRTTLGRLRKAELQAKADELGVDRSGTKAAIIARLLVVLNDNVKVKQEDEEVKVKTEVMEETKDEVMPSLSMKKKELVPLPSRLQFHQPLPKP